MWIISMKFSQAPKEILPNSNAIFSRFEFIAERFNLQSEDCRCVSS